MAPGSRASWISRSRTPAAGRSWTSRPTPTWARPGRLSPPGRALRRGVDEGDGPPRPRRVASCLKSKHEGHEGQHEGHERVTKDTKINRQIAIRDGCRDHQIRQIDHQITTSPDRQIHSSSPRSCQDEIHMQRICVFCGSSVGVNPAVHRGRTRLGTDARGARVFPRLRRRARRADGCPRRRRARCGWRGDGCHSSRPQRPRDRPLGVDKNCTS